jgi:glycosyltransferase involved in cell wall biosynthesis
MANPLALGAPARRACCQVSLYEPGLLPGDAGLDYSSIELPHLIACPAPYGVGGLGQHLRCIVEDARTTTQLNGYYCSRGQAGDPLAREVGTSSFARWMSELTPFRLSPGWKTLIGSVSFDRNVAKRIPRGRNYFSGFVGSARNTLLRARRIGYARLDLESPTCHVLHVRERHLAARAAWPIEEDWLNAAYARRAQDEYQLADQIVVSSEYVKESFLSAGTPIQSLRRRHLRVDERFQSTTTRPKDGVFRVVYTGGLTVAKGVPVLVKAFGMLKGNAELRLIGGWATRAMRRYLQSCLQRDPRIVIQPGDPLPHLQRADAYVHPAYQEGLGLAPLEAMACGVPVIVSADTGMKEYVTEGVNGYVVPTGDPGAIFERLEQMYRAR